MSKKKEANKSTLPVLIKLFLPILLLSGIYLYFVTTFLLDATDPTCIEEKKSVMFFSSSIRCNPMELNEIGDYFAGLLAVLSTFWLVIAFAWQALELRFQRDEFLKTNMLAAQRNKAEDVWHRVEFIEMKKSEMAEICTQIFTLLSDYGMDVPQENDDFKKQLKFLENLPQAELLDKQLEISVPMETVSSYKPLRIRARALCKAVALASKENVVTETVGLS